MLTKTIHRLQVRPAQAHQTILYQTQMIQAHRHLHPQAAGPTRLIHPAQAPTLVQALNQLTAVKNTTNQNHRH